MTRFTMIALACLLAVPARAAECVSQPILTIYPELDANMRCLNLRCHGLRLLREAYQRGEITAVHLSTRSECNTLSRYDVATGETVRVPCTWDHDDYFRR